VVAILFGIVFFKRLKQQLDREIMILVWSAALTFLLFSFSKFQLPHYIVILFPHFAVFVAIWLMTLKNSEKRIMTWSVWIVILLLIGIVILLSVSFPFFNILLMMAVFLTILFALTGFRKSDWLNRLLWRGICFSFLCSVFFAQFIYGTLMQYNAGMNAALWINQNHQNEKVVLLSRNVSAIFYLQPEFEAKEQLTANDFSKPDQSILVFCPVTSISDIVSQNFDVEILEEFDYFRITMLTTRFLSSKSRPSQLKKFAVVRCTQQKSDGIL